MLKVLTVLIAAGLCSAEAESLLIGPGDLLHVQVFDTPELEQHVRISDSGDGAFLFIGSTQMAGRTPTEAAEVVAKALINGKYMLHPQVTVSIEQYATQSVSILGEVAKAGVYSIATPQPILHVLALAGGLAQGADRMITVERHSDPAQRVNYFLSNTSKAALDDSITIYPGDTILVPKAAVVYVLGDVGRPGGYSAQTNDSQLTILQVLALAGSANKTSTLSKARLIRSGPHGAAQEIPLQLASIQDGTAPNLVLQGNDIIFVPFSWMKNMALSASSIASSTSSAAIYAIK